MGYRTLDPENQFQFKCPIFNAETKMATCVKLRNMVWRGQQPAQRKGCQACMSAGKCPVAVIAQRMAMSNPAHPVEDPYQSATPVVGKLRKDVLMRIKNVVVMSSTLQRFRLSEAELTAIETSSDRIRMMIGSAPNGSTATAVIKGKGRKRKSLSNPKPSEVKETSNSIKMAAASGDLSAAI